MRLIDADVFISYLKEVAKGEDTFYVQIMGKFINMVNVMADNEPINQWIPCSERLPNNESLVLVYYIFNEQIEDKKDIWIGWHEMDGVWYVDGEEHGEEWNNEVIAWMPLPEPYKGE